MSQEIVIIRFRLPRKVGKSGEEHRFLAEFAVRSSDEKYRAYLAHLPAWHRSMNAEFFGGLQPPTPPLRSRCTPLIRRQAGQAPPKCRVALRLPQAQMSIQVYRMGE